MIQPPTLLGDSMTRHYSMGGTMKRVSGHSFGVEDLIDCGLRGDFQLKANGDENIGGPCLYCFATGWLGAQPRIGRLALASGLLSLTGGARFPVIGVGYRAFGADRLKSASTSCQDPACPTWSSEIWSLEAIDLCDVFSPGLGNSSLVVPVRKGENEIAIQVQNQATMPVTDATDNLLFLGVRGLKIKLLEEREHNEMIDISIDRIDFVS
jgi:hypothetical protein